MDDSTAPSLDRPWRRPGAVRSALGRIRGLLRSPVNVGHPDPDGIVVDRDVAVANRAGTILHVDVHRPPGDGPWPVLMSGHTSGNERVPAATPTKRGLSFRYRALRQTGRIRFSHLTGWEAPDPVWWVGSGYVVVDADRRGEGTSHGTGALLSESEGADVYDLVEWAAAQPWSTGAVGLLGVSYPALSQWKAPALRPPSLRAVCPREGSTDHARPSRDEWWQSPVIDLPPIEVPTLVFGRFSDNLHSRESFRAFEQIASPDRFLHTHRGRRATVADEQSLQVQRAFFDHYLRGTDDAPPPRVRLEVRETRTHVADVRAETSWPLERTVWTPLHVTGSGLSIYAPQDSGSITFDTAQRGVRVGWVVPHDVELTGPMALRLSLSMEGADDVDIVAGVEKWRRGKYVGFEGSHGFGRDRVTTGWQQAALRDLDTTRSRPFDPVPSFTSRTPLQPGEVVGVEVALGPSSTMFRAGDELRLVVAGRWLWPRNPLTGQSPAWVPRSPRGRCTLYWGPDRPTSLLVPVVPSTRAPSR